MKNIKQILKLLLVCQLCISLSQQQKVALNKSFPWAQIGKTKTIILEETAMSLRATLGNAARDEVVW